MNARRGGIDEELVEKPGAHRYRVGFGLQFRSAVLAGIFFGGRTQFPVDHPGEEINAHRPYQGSGERVTNDRVGVLGGQRPGRRDHRGRGAHARGQIPTVGITARHNHPSVNTQL